MCSSRAVSALNKCFIVVPCTSGLENQTLAYVGLQKRDDLSSFVALTLRGIDSAMYREQLKVISGTYGTRPFFPTDVLATGTYSHRIVTCYYSFNKTGFQQEFLHFPASDEFCFDSLSIKGS